MNSKKNAQEKEKSDKKSFRNSFIEQFIQRLDSLTNDKQNKMGDIANLKRAAGTKLGESMKATAIFYQLLPFQLKNAYEEEIYYMIATLYFLNPKPLKNKNLGDTYRLISLEHDSESLKQRFFNLLESQINTGELANNLRHTIKLAASKNVGVDWICLTRDLLRWNLKSNYTINYPQKEWAKSFLFIPKTN